MDVNPGAAEDITYDLVSAVKRQSSFYYQVFAQSSPQYMHVPMSYKITCWLINSKFYTIKLYFISLYTEKATIFFNNTLQMFT